MIHWARGNRRYREVEALENISLRIDTPGVVGFIGSNGAGKTTLLKVIAGVLKPPSGTVRVKGTVAPILALGAGFDHELSGRENIQLNALLLGHTKAEAREKEQDIIDFSALGPAIDSAIKTYSSGMVARLAFGVATAWRPDILILDEVLAVGDVSFQEKCKKRIHRLVGKGTITLVVNHSPNAVAEICDRVVWLEGGTVRGDGESLGVLTEYLNFMGTSQAIEQPKKIANPLWG